ncbi:hypothetical protein [Acinetobacter sp. ANC 4640]
MTIKTPVTEKTIKDYARSVYVESGTLTQQIAEQIDKGDQTIIDNALIQKQASITRESANIADLSARESNLSRVDSIQEARDNLPDILNPK